MRKVILAGGTIALILVTGFVIVQKAKPGPLPSPASNSNTNKGCEGVHSGTSVGNLTVSTGQNCTFVNGSVTGNIQQSGGTLILVQTQVNGNVQINGASTFTIGPGSTIRGNLQIQNLPISPSHNQVCGTTVHGNLQFQNSGIAVLIGSTAGDCAANTVDGNLQVQNNSGATTVSGNNVSGNLDDSNNSGPTEVFNNVVGGNLTCRQDSSITGGGNKAKSEQGECAVLSGAPWHTVTDASSGLSFVLPQLASPPVANYSGPTSDTLFVIYIGAQNPSDGLVHSLLGLFALPNPLHENIRSWFEQNVDDASSTLLTSGAFQQQQLTNGIALVQVASIPTTYQGGPVAQAYLLPASNDRIYAINESQDSQLTQFGYSATSVPGILTSVLGSIQ